MTEAIKTNGFNNLSCKEISEINGGAIGLILFGAFLVATTCITTVVLLCKLDYE